MVEELEITEQVEQQQDPPTKKRALYDAVSKKYNLGSYEEFETKLKDPAKRKALYDHVGKEFELGTFQEFETKLQEPPPPKKKVSTVSFGETYSSPELDSETPSTSEIPTVVDYGDGEPLPNNIVDLSRKATEYSKKTKEIERTDMRGNPIPETIPDESFIGTSKKIIEDLDKQGIKKDFVDAVSELPDEAFNDPNTSKDKLVELYKTNRIKFHQFVNEQKNRIAIKRGAFENQKNANNGIDDIDPNQMAIHVANKYLGTYEEAHPQNLNQLQNIISKKQDIIEHSLIGEERTKALDRVRESYSSYINPTNPDIQAEYEQSPLKNKVDITQYSALKTLQLFDAKKYEQAVNILNTDIQKQYTFKPEFENFQSPVAASPSVTTSDSTLAAKNKGSLSSETIDQQIGKESVLRQLTELGRNNLVTQINSQQYDLEQSFNNTDNPEEKEAIKQQYVLNQGKLDEVSKNASQDNIKFPLTSKLEFDNQVKELVQDAGMGAVEYGTNKFAHGVGVGGESFEDMAVSIFGSEKDKALLGMKRMGESKWFESKTYLPEDYRSTNSPFIMQPSEALKDAAKGITGGKKLSDLSADQKQQLTELVANNQSQIETVTNPKAGKSKNFFSKATLYSNTGFIGEVGAFMYKIMGAKSLGLSGKSAELLTLYNDGYSASYTEKLKEGASAEEANQYGVLHGGVMLLAGTVSSKFDAVKDMLAASKSPISKQILGLGEAGWDAIVNKNKSTISKIANGVSDVVKSNAKMIGTYGVGVSIASDLADKGFFNKDISVSEMADNVKHSAIDMAIGSVGLAGIGFISHAIKNPVTLKDKATIWEIGDNKEFSKQRIDEAVAKNELTQAEGDAKKKVIDNVAYLIDKVPTENSKGKLLTDNEKVKLLYNLILKEKGKEAAKDLPDNQSDKAEHIALVADYANGIILENPTDKQLESRKSTLEKQIEGKDENGKPLLPEKELLKAKAQLEAVTNAIERKENNVEVQAPISTGESIPLKTEEQSRNENGIVVEKPMVIPEPITISPNPTKSEPTVKEETSTVSDVSSGVKPNWDYEGEGDALSGKDGQLAYTQRLLPDWNRESQKGNINPDSKVTYDIVRGRFGGQDNKDVVEAKDENGVTVGLIKLSSNGGIEHLVVAPEFRKKGIATELYNRLKNENPSVDISKTKQRTKDFADWANKLKSETKSDIEKRRQEEIGKIENPSRIANQIKIEAINAKYDAELSAIEVQQSTEVEKPTITEPNKVGEEAETAVKKEEQPPIVPPITPLTNTERSNEGELRDKGVLASMHKSVPESAKSKVDEKGLKYRVASQAEAKAIATQILEDNGVDIAIEYASNAKLDGDVRSMLYNVSLNKLAEMEKAETNETAKKEIANKYADTLIDYDEMGRDAGRFNSAIFDFYKSPLGMEFYENKKRDNAFKKEQTKNGKSWDEFYEEFKDEPEFGAMVQAEILKEKMKKPGFAKKAADSLRKKADGILKNGITPDWLKADVKDAKTKGIDAKMVDKAIAKALKIIADAIEVGGNIANVIAEQVQKIKELGVSAKDSEIAKWLYKESGATGMDAKTFEEKVKQKIESLEKTIKDLEEKIKNNDTSIKKKEVISNDDIVALESKVKELRVELETIRKEAKVGKYSDESKVAAAEKAAQKNIEELEDKIANNDLEFDKIEKPTSPQLEAYREKQKALRKELEEKRKEAKVGKYSDESRITAIEDRVKEYERKISEKDYASKSKEEYTGKLKDAKEQLKDAKKAYFEAKKDFPAYKAKMSERYLDRMRKKLKGLNEKQQREVIEQSFRKLAENGALDQADFREIIKNTLGLGKLGKAEADVMKSLVEDINAVDDARKNFVNENGSPESEKKLNDAEMKALKSKQKLATIVHTQTDAWNTVRAAMQLTAIGVPTILKNFAWNFVQQGLIKFPANAIISLADASVSKAANILNLPYSRTTSLFGGEQGYFFKNMKKGIKEGVLALKYGINSKDYFDKEVYTKPIQPVKNAKELLDWAKGNSKLKVGEVLDKAIKASPTGYYMEMVSRGLTFFDKPLRYAAEGGAAARIGSKELGLSGQQLNVFTRSPKEYAIKHFQSKGDDIATATKKAESIVSRITEAGDKSVAQQANMLSDAFNNFGRFIKDKTDENVLGKNIVGAGKIALTPATLFIKTPANVAWQVFNLVNPEIAIAQSLGLSANAYKKYKNGDVTYKQDIDRAKDWMGTAVVGIGMGVLGQFLSGIGVVESGEDEDTKKKERDATKQYSKKFTFNYSKFNRYVQGIPDSDNDQDLRIDLSWFGQLGAMMDLKERMRKLKQDEPDMSDLDMAMNEFSESAKIAMSSSVLNSASALSQAFTSYDGFKGYGVNSINTMANIIHPQALAQHSRAELDNEYQVKADSFLKQLDNSFAARSSLYRKVTGHYPPSDIGIWGDEMKKGGSAGLRYFGISRDNKNPFAKEIYDDAERTGNLDFLPSAVKNSITKNGETVKLPTEAARYLEQQVGTERKKLITAYIDGALTIPGYGKYNTLTDQKKIEALSVIYKAGYDKGKYDFYQKYPQYNNEKTKKEKSDDKKESYQKKVLKNAINKK